MRASPLAADPEKAARWRDADRSGGGGQRRRYLVRSADRTLLAVLRRDPRDDQLRIERLATAVETAPGSRPAALPALCAELFSDATWTLVRMLEETVPEKRRETASEGRLLAWAMQLLLGTRRGAGVALSTTTRWPHAWVGRLGRGAAGGRPPSGMPGPAARQPATRNGQIGVLRWRLATGEWPDPGAHVLARGPVVIRTGQHGRRGAESLGGAGRSLPPSAARCP